MSEQRPETFVTKALRAYEQERQQQFGTGAEAIPDRRNGFAQLVGWVERKRNHRGPCCVTKHDGFRKCSTHPTSFAAAFPLFTL